MNRSPLYSSSQRPRPHGDQDRGEGAPPRDSASDTLQDRTPEGEGEAAPGRLGHLYRRHERPALLAAGGAVVFLAVVLHGAFQPAPRELTQRDIDRAVLHTMENQPRPPSVESEAYRFAAPSVVRVERLAPDGGEGDAGDERGRPQVDGLGTGVVVDENGTILTNLHVVAGVERLQVVFLDGTESPADIIAIRPEQDLAVIRASILPDDLVPATLRSTRDLRVGDRVTAVGFPFGIGPSLTSGVVSGMRREYRNPDGERLLSNLIQFDAAANPGNSGGPLVTEEGFVVGIVTAILNPNNQRVFVGIGFAVPIETAMEAVGSSPF